MSKTLVMFDMFGQDDTFFFELEGDWSRLDGVLLNAVAPKGTAKKVYEALQDELNRLIYTDDGDYKLQEDKRLLYPTKEWDYFVRCGFVP